MPLTLEKLAQNSEPLRIFAREDPVQIQTAAFARDPGVEALAACLTNPGAPLARFHVRVERDLRARTGHGFRFQHAAGIAAQGDAESISRAQSMTIALSRKRAQSASIRAAPGAGREQSVSC